MTMDDIKALIGAMGASDLAEMEVAKDGWTLRLVRDVRAEASPVPDCPTADRNHLRPHAVGRPRRTHAVDAESLADEMRAPLGGVVYLAASPGAAPFVSVGRSVEAGALLCTIEAMKTFHEVRAERAGIVAAILVATGDEVEAGQPLVRFG